MGNRPQTSKTSKTAKVSNGLDASKAKNAAKVSKVSNVSNVAKAANTSGSSSASPSSSSRYQPFLLWLGFGLFIVTYGGGPLGFVSGSANQTVCWDLMLLITLTFMVGTALGCVLMTHFRLLGSTQQRLGVVGYVGVTILCLALQPVLATSDIESSMFLRGLLSLLAGIFYAPPLLFWVNRCRDMSLVLSRFAFLSLLVCCYLFDPIVIALSGLASDIPFVYSVSMVLCAIVSAILQVRFSHSSASEKQGAKPKSASVKAQMKDYRLSIYSTTVLIGLGFSWGIAVGASLLILGESVPNNLVASFLATFGLLLVSAAATFLLRTQGTMRFGAFIRLTLIGCGAVMAALPLLFVVAPVLLHSPCYFVTAICEIAVLVFSIDLSCEEGRPLESAYSVNYAMLIGVACVAGLFFWVAHLFAEGIVAWLVVAMVATWVVLGVIPFLPSRSSNAAVLSLDRLPENEGYEAHVALQRESMAARYGLSEGEAEVLRYLLMGM